MTIIEFQPRGGKTSCGNGLRAFTLAEVLITLGIIGVVAAMTLPTLIQNYQKGVAVNRLKQTYAQVQNAIETVAARDFEGLPLHQWKCSKNTPKTGTLYRDGADLCLHLAMDEIAVKLYPESDSVNHAFCYEGKEYRPYIGLNGSRDPFQDGKHIAKASLSAKLPNGACVMWGFTGYSGDFRGAMTIDIDGPYAGYNQEGKDVFLFDYARIGSVDYGYGKNGRTIIPTGMSASGTPPESISFRPRADLIDGCKKSTYGQYCAALIMNDGWQMKSDYPW